MSDLVQQLRHLAGQDHAWDCADAMLEAAALIEELAVSNGPANPPGE